MKRRIKRAASEKKRRKFIEKYVALLFGTVKYENNNNKYYISTIKKTIINNKTRAIHTAHAVVSITIRRASQKFLTHLLLSLILSLYVCVSV